MTILTFPVREARHATIQRRQDRRHELLDRCRIILEDGLGYLSAGDRLRAEERMVAALDVKRMTSDMMRVTGVDPITKGYYPEAALMDLYMEQSRIEDALELLQAVMNDYLEDDECMGPAVFWYIQWVQYALKWWRRDKAGGRRILNAAINIYPEPEKVISMIESLGRKPWPQGY